MNIVELSESIAREAHKGQKRRNGDDYFTHPERVRQIVNIWLNNAFNECSPLTFEFYVGQLIHKFFASKQNILSQNEFIDVCEATANCHDTIEDNKNYSLLKLESIFLAHSDRSINPKLIDRFIGAIDSITRRENETYTNYILRLAINPIAKIVKLADLEDNLSDSTNGSRRDKYELARELLLKL